MTEMLEQGWRAHVQAMDAAGRADEALETVQCAAFTLPDDVELAFNVGERLRSAGRLKNAAAVFALLSFTSDTSSRFRALLDHADCLRKLGHFEIAAEQILTAKMIDPCSHWPLIAMADLYAASGRDNERLNFLQDHYNELRADGKAEVARYVSGMQAHGHFEATRQTHGWGPRSPRQIQALDRAGMILLIKDEEDIIGQNLRHHYHLGFRSFCILNNNSKDKSRHIIEKFKNEYIDCLIILIDDPVFGHYQAKKMAIYARTFVEHAALAERQIEWLFFIDADEFICIGTNLDNCIPEEKFEENLNDPEALILVFHWIHCSSFSVLERFESNSDPFSVFGKICLELYPVVPKVAFRINKNFHLLDGNHFVAEITNSLSSVRTVALYNWYIWHFSLRSIEHVRKKIVNGGLAFEGTKGLENHGGHWRERYKLLVAHGDSITRQVLMNHITSITA